MTQKKRLSVLDYCNIVRRKTRDSFTFTYFGVSFCNDAKKCSGLKASEKEQEKKNHEMCTLSI